MKIETELRLELKKYIQSMITDIQSSIEITDRTTHKTIRVIELDIKSQLQSRVDKLTTQLVKTTDKLRSDIPPTNAELLSRVTKIEEDVYTLRMNI